MEKLNIEELAMAVAMLEYYSSIVENGKEIIRNLSNEEVEKINESNKILIKREKQTNITYSKEYKDEVKKLQEKFPPEKTTIENGRIKLTATAYTTSKRKIITDKFTNLNKAQLKAASKNAKIK